MANEEVKRYAHDKGINMYMVADELSLCDSAFSRKYMRYEMNEDDRRMVLGVIDRICERNGER